MTLILLLALTTYRITRLVIADDFPPVLKLRIWLLGTDRDALKGTRLEWVGELLSCHWCVSVWISAGLVLITQMLTGDVQYPWLVWPSCAAAGALLYHREDD